MHEVNLFKTPDVNLGSAGVSKLEMLTLISFYKIYLSFYLQDAFRFVYF